jgi:hypothetical protein
VRTGTACLDQTGTRESLGCEHGDPARLLPTLAGRQVDAVRADPTVEFDLWAARPRPDLRPARTDYRVRQPARKFRRGNPLLVTGSPVGRPCPGQRAHRFRRLPTPALIGAAMRRQHGGLTLALGMSANLSNPLAICPAASRCAPPRSQDLRRCSPALTPGGGLNSHGLPSPGPALWTCRLHGQDFVQGTNPGCDPGGQPQLGRQGLHHRDRHLTWAFVSTVPAGSPY